MLEVGEMAPDFSLQDQKGETVTLSGLRGKTVVLFFYPKADTPGCTVESCSFRDAYADFGKADAVVLGISPDTVKAQSKFAEKFGFPMQMLADVGHAVAEAYGVWIQKSMYGRSYMGVSRETFVIGPDGKIRHIFRKVKPEGHAAEVLATLKGG
ncbi:MAG TPA: thioredoxin-dependent thiol peroxidase [Chthonomonadaceae bacterium]|nr:thioredoxin-dependent thiol peroxidase [Chthonomonadaceae bacterium]